MLVFLFSKNKMQIHEYFGSIEDPRIERSKLHSLSTILGLTIVASLCGIKSWEQISSFGEFRQKELSAILDFSNGVPSHDTLERVYSMINPQYFLDCFMSWTQALNNCKGLIAIDGKVARSSYDTYHKKGAIYLVNAWANENKLVLGQYLVEGKGHEIEGIKQLLALLDIKGSIVTIDAIGCQKEIVSQIIEKEADYLIAVKDNQETLRENITSSFAVLRPCDQHTDLDKNGGRVEIRTCSVIDNLKMIENFDQWSGLKSIIQLESTRSIGKVTQTEVRYYISSLNTSAETFNKSIRGHWGIENSLHWQLDVSFNEDKSRKRKGFSAQNYSLTNKIAINLLNSEKKSKLPLVKKKLKANYDIGYIKELIFFDA
jgi:predicted transposase YbfD/YdcC